MKQAINPVHIVEFSPERRVMSAILDLSPKKHCMYALLEVDVTGVKQFIEDFKAQTGEQLSFTGYLAFCLARAVAENKAIQSYRKGRKQLMIFDDVDVGLMIEQRIGDGRRVTGHVLRCANCRSYREIHREIRSVQFGQAPVSAESVSWFNSAMLLPGPLPRIFQAFVRIAMRQNPTMITSMMGTVGISSVGMFGEGHGGWAISPGSHTLDLIVGSTVWKPAIVDQRIEPREILCLTMVFDHEMIDGGPAARFARRLVELIESGFGLDKERASAAMDAQSVAKVPV